MIKKMINSSHLAEPVKITAALIFEKLAIAEAKVHGMPVEEVVFHEVGAIDSILDIVGFSLGVHMLGIETFSSSPLPISGGLIQTDHGEIPLPAPATLDILKGWKTRPGEVGHEQVTPTGAAIICTLCSQSHFPAMVPLGSGYGAGTRNPTEYANIVRVSLGERTSDLKDTPTEIVEVRTQLDDMVGEEFPFLIEKLLDAGALDAFGQSIIMKKGRLGTLLTFICTPDKEHLLCELSFKHSSTFGLRSQRLKRHILNRHTESLETPYGQIKIKIGTHNGERLQYSPEYEDLAAAARRHNVSISEIKSHIYQNLKIQ